MLRSFWFNDPLFSLVDRLLPWQFPPLGEAGAAPAVIASCPVAIYEDGERFYVQAVVPGMTPDQIQLTWQDNALTISGEVSYTVPQGAELVWSELQPYRFRRTIQLGAEVDLNRVEAHLENGVLTIVAPKAEHARTKKIPILPGTAQKQLAGAR